MHRYTLGITLLIVSAAALAGGCVADGGDPGTVERHPLGKADATGSCLAPDGPVCDGRSDGTCWCDSLCTGYGDCCDDYQATCAGGDSTDVPSLPGGDLNLTGSAKDRAQRRDYVASMDHWRSPVGNTMSIDVGVTGSNPGAPTVSVEITSDYDNDLRPQIGALSAPIEADGSFAITVDVSSDPLKLGLTSCLSDPSTTCTYYQYERTTGTIAGSVSATSLEIDSYALSVRRVAQYRWPTGGSTDSNLDASAYSESQPLTIELH